MADTTINHIMPYPLNNSLICAQNYGIMIVPNGHGLSLPQGGITMVTGSLQIKRDKYYVVINDKDDNGKRIQKWIPTGLTAKNNKRKAEDAKAKILAEYAAKKALNVNEQPASPLVSDWIKNWVYNRQVRLQTTTFDGYVHMLKKHILPYFDKLNITLAELLPKHIEDYITIKLKSGISANTIIKQLAVISSALKDAHKNHLITSNPADDVDKPKRNKYQHDCYNAAELKALLTAIKGSAMEAVIFLAACYGLRRSEVLGLKWSAVDYERNVIKINYKIVRVKDEDGKLIDAGYDKMKSESSEREVPLSPDIIEALKRIKAKQQANRDKCDNYNEADSEYICVNSKGNRYKTDYVSSQFGKILKKHNLRHIRFHDLRHSTATLMIHLGFNMKEVQSWLGHADYCITANTYAHVHADDKSKMAASIASTLLV